MIRVLLQCLPGLKIARTFTGYEFRSVRDRSFPPLPPLRSGRVSPQNCRKDRVFALIQRDLDVRHTDPDNGTIISRSPHQPLRIPSPSVCRIPTASALYGFETA